MFGIDMSMFSAHSARSASTFTEKKDLVPIQEILDRALWSSAQKFYFCFSQEHR